MSDPVPGHMDIMRDWFLLSDMKGEEHAEAIARIEEWLSKKERARKRRPRDP